MAPSKISPGKSVALAVLLAVTIATGLPVLSSTAVASQAIGALHVVPITLTNSQSSPTPAPFQQMIVVDSAAYAAFEAPNLQNVEFLYPNGVAIPSWLESGNSNTAAATVYWLKLSSAIPASSSITIYLGFADVHVNLFSISSHLPSEFAGEAPELSPTYAQYDNGRAIFSFYDNFATASSLSSWSYSLAGGSLAVDNGLTVNFATSGQYFVSTGTYGPGTAFDASVTYIADTDNVGYVNINEPGFGTGGAVWSGAFIRLACGVTYPDQVSAGEDNGCGGGGFGYILPSEGVNGVYSVDVLSSSSSIQYVGYSTGSSTQPISGQAPNYPSNVGFQIANCGGGPDCSGYGNSLSVQWARVRAAPPNGVMPSVSFGNLEDYHG